MKIVLTLLVRDEEDIVQAVLDYHLRRGVDFIIATDNCSSDGTGEILRSFERRGVLHYIYEPDDTYSQSIWVTRMARMACTQFQADWVINGDADEFWWPEEGDLRNVFERVGRSAEAITVQRTNFVPRTDAADNFFADTMTYSERQPKTALGQPLPDKVCHRGFADIVVAQGNHSVFREGQALAAVNAPLTILHFPMRTYRQFANKIEKGGAAYARNAALSQETGATWRKLYSLWQRGQLADFYSASTFNDAAIKSALENGSLLFDDRLKRFFH